MTHHQLKSATHLLAVSEATKRDLMKQVGIEGSKITVTYEGFKSNQFSPASKGELRKDLGEYNLEEGNFYLFVGSIQPRKNLERLIRAYKQAIFDTENISKDKNNLPKLVLIGKKGWLAEEIYSLPKELGIVDYVKFLGFVEDEKLKFFYQGAKAFLFPSLFEGFGLPILEAFASRCPVLTSNTSSMPEVAGEAAVLVDPYSIQSISEGIIRISKEDVRKSLIKKGEDQLKKFSWERCARETLEVINSI